MKFLGCCRMVTLILVLFSVAVVATEARGQTEPAESGPTTAPPKVDPSASDDSDSDDSDSDGTTSVLSASELQAALVVLQQQVAQHSELLRKQVEISSELAARINENRTVIDANTLLIKEAQERITSNVELIDQNYASLKGVLDQQQQILDSISRQDTQGRYLPRLDANMSNPEFADEMKTVVEKLQPSDGALIIRNTLAHSQVIVVNGEQHTIVSGAFLTLRLPVGNVVTQVPGGQPVNWFIGAPEFEQRIRLTY